MAILFTTPALKEFHESFCDEDYEIMRRRHSFWFCSKDVKEFFPGASGIIQFRVHNRPAEDRVKIEASPNSLRSIHGNDCEFMCDGIPTIISLEAVVELNNLLSRRKAVYVECLVDETENEINPFYPFI